MGLRPVRDGLAIMISLPQLHTIYRSTDRVKECIGLQSAHHGPRVTLEDPARAATTLDWMAKDMDFTDALHPTKAEGCTAFVSFAKRLAKATRRLSQFEVPRL